MREMARRPEKDKRDLFRAAAQQMHLHEAIVEKDFWVCWVLDYLFEESAWANRMAFKGGTSLSKAFGAIERFSEDIDLILDWRLLGYSEREAWAERSASKQEAFGEEANRKAAAFLAEDFVPGLCPALEERASADLGIEALGQDVLIHYPKAFSLESIQPQIRLEIGSAGGLGSERNEDHPPLRCGTVPTTLPSFMCHGTDHCRRTHLLGKSDHLASGSASWTR